MTQAARPFFERRARGSNGKGRVVAAIAGVLLKRLEEQAVTATGPACPAASTWKVGWRPGAGRWTGLIGGAGGLR